MKIENKKTLLLVEDEVILAMSEKMSLENYGYSVVTADSGENAIKVFKTNQKIDLILMDINLGSGIDGTETAEIILKKTDLPIVFLSSHIEPEVVEKTERITSYGYVVKSSSITVLDASIKMAFKLFDAHKEIKQQNMLIRTGNEKLKVTIDELETGRNRLTSIFRAAPIGIGIVIDRILTDVNQRICEMTGYKEEELVGKTARILYPTKEEFDFVGKEKYAQIKLKNTGTVETQWKCKDGEIIDVLLSSTPLDTNDYTKGVTFTALNITEMKQIEDSLRKSEETLSFVMDGVPTLLAYFDADLHFIYLNKTHAEWYAKKKEDIVGKHISKIMPEKVYKRALPQFHKVLNGEIVNFDNKTHDSNGQERYVYAKLIPHVNNGKVIGFFASISDITDRKQMELKLENTISRVNGVIEGTNAGTWEWNVQTGEAVLNNRWAQILGYTLDELQPVSIKTWEDLSHPEDLKESEVLLNRHFSGKTSYYNFESRMKHKDGHWIWVLDRGKVISRTKDGKPLMMFGTQQDITDRKQAEILLEQTRTNYKTFFNTIDDFIFILDEQGAIIFTNNTVINRLGYSTEELYGESILIVHPPERRDEAGRIVGEMLSGKTEFCPVPVMTKSGIQIPVETRVTKGEWNGNPAFFGVTKDISRVQLSEEKFSKLFHLNPSACGLSNLDDHTYIEVNKAFYTLLGFERNEVIGKTAADLDLISPESIDSIMSKADNNGNVTNIETELKAKNGDIKQVLLSTENIYVQNKKYCFTVANNITERSRYENKIKALLTEKELILKEVHHRIKNNFTTIESLLALQAASCQNTEVQEALNVAHRRVAGMSILYEKMLLTENYQTTSANGYLNDLVDDIINLFSNKPALTIKKQFDDVQLDTKVLFPIALIVNELLTNIMKYSFEGRDTGFIQIIFKKKNGEITLIMQDNGNGLPKGFDTRSHKGFGLMLIEMLSNQLSGKFTIEDKNGVRSTISFPA